MADLSHDRGRALVIVVAVIAIAVIAFRFFGGGLLRGWAESTMNEELDGYTVTLPELRLDVLGLGLQLHELTIRQEAHPEPAVASFERLGLTLSWSSLLRGELLAELEIATPRLHVDRTQIVEEASDEEDIEDRGWQDALLAIYPLEVNRLQVSDGAVTYIESDEEEPLRLDDVHATARNIRNVVSPSATYPSSVELEASLFDSGRLRLDGDADFLARPYPAAAADFELESIPLAALDSLTDEVDVRMREGVLSAEGSIEYGPDTKDVYLRRVRLDGVDLIYVDRSADTDDQRRRAELVEETAETLSREEATRVYLDLLEIRGSDFAYERVDEYRLHVSDVDLSVRDVVNREPEKPSSLEADGRFMGAGKLSLLGSYRAGRETPEFDLNVRIEETPLPKLNDVFRSYANFDVNAGTFAFYSELVADGGRLDGYVKPILKNMDVYDRSQDRDRSIVGEAYEGAVGMVAAILQNPSDNVAAKIEVAGRIDDPDVSPWEAILSLVQNAFIRAVSPGIEGEIPESANDSRRADEDHAPAE